MDKTLEEKIHKVWESANKDAAVLCQKLDEAILSKDLSKYDGFLPLIEKETTTQCVGLGRLGRLK